jgi:hypothetical protein
MVARWNWLGLGWKEGAIALNSAIANFYYTKFELVEPITLIVLRYN